MRAHNEKEKYSQFVRGKRVEELTLVDQGADGGTRSAPIDAASAELGQAQLQWTKT